MTTLLTLEELKSRCTYWQRRLRLQDWTIFLDVQSAKDMKADDNDGEIQMLQVKRQAWITILDPADYPAHADEPQDMERTLVHELLHIHFTEIHQGRRLKRIPHVAEERAIDAISRALVEVERRA